MKKFSFANYFKNKKELGFYISRQHIKKGVQLHNHDFFEIELVVSAKDATHVLNGRTYPLESGSIYFLNPSDIHSIEIGKDGHFDRYNVLFRQDIISEDILASVINVDCTTHLEPREFDAMLKLFEALSFYFSLADGGKTEAIGSRIIETMLLTFQKNREAPQDASPLSESNSNTRSQVQKILLYIHNNFREDITLADIAAYSSFSPHYISQLFHSMTSSTLTQYITRLRLEYAKNLLFSTDYSITEICYKCGFHSFAHFLRSFKKHYGQSPAKYRSLMKAGAITPVNAGAPEKKENLPH